MKSFFPENGRRRGFSLIELLTVVALIAILAVAVLPALSSMSGSGRTRQNLIQISGALEKAREYAVSRNTYTWVAWRMNNVSTDRPVLQMAFASADGSTADVPSSGTYSGPYGGTNRVVPIDRPQKLEGCRLKAGSALPSDSPIRTRVENFAGGAALTGPGFSSYTSTQTGTVDFDASIMFTPAGEARVSAALPENIQFALIPLKGADTEDTAGASLVRVSGLTGRVKVYQP